MIPFYDELWIDLNSDGSIFVGISIESDFVKVFPIQDSLRGTYRKKIEKKELIRFCILNHCELGLFNEQILSRTEANETGTTYPLDNENFAIFNNRIFHVRIYDILIKEKND